MLDLMLPEDATVSIDFTAQWPLNRYAVKRRVTAYTAGGYDPINLHM
jgi:hypothetical protein